MNIFDWLTCITVVIAVQVLPLQDGSSKWWGLVLVGFALLFANKAGRLTEAKKRGTLKIRKQS